MRWFMSLLALFFFVSGCDYSALEDLQCARTTDCPAEATCRSGFCAFDGTSTNNDTNNALKVATLTVTPTAATLTPGDTVTLSVAAFNASGEALATDSVTWATSSDAVASVDALGVVTALSVGVSDLTATLDGVSAAAVITVENPVDSITVTPATLELGLNTQETLVAEAFDARGNPLTRTFTWASDDVAVATVSSSGVVFGKSVGTAAVTASVEGITGTSAIEVKEFPIVSLVVDPATARVRQGATLSITAVMTDDQGNEVIGKFVKWGYNPATYGGLAAPDVDRPDIVVFSAVTNKVGFTTITAELETEGLTSQSVIEVYRPVVSTVTLTPADPTTTIGTSTAMTVAVVDEDGLPVTGRPVTWSVDDPTVATIDSNGLLVTLSAGTVMVTADVEGVTGTSTVTVAGILFQSVSAGATHSCGVTAAGFGFCWGDGADGRLGTEATSDEQLPTAVKTSMTFAEIHAANQHSCGRSGDQVYCWGNRSSGRLGGGTTTSSSSVPELVSGGLAFSQVSTSVDHTCAVSDANEIYCWGAGGSGRLGSNDNADLSVPTKIVAPIVEPSAEWAMVAAGRDHTCALTVAGKAYCWGHNGEGELGNGANSESRVAIPVMTTEVFSTISVGDRFSCGLTAAGALHCWGENTDGKLGIASSDSSKNTPTLVAGLNFSSINLGKNHACGVSGLLGYCWGSGANGRLGTGNTDSENAPTAIPGSPAFSSISAGDHSCGIAGGLGFCFGANAVGQLGDNSLTERLIPTSVYP